MGYKHLLSSQNDISLAISEWKSELGWLKLKQTVNIGDTKREAKKL